MPQDANAPTPIRPATSEATPARPAARRARRRRRRWPWLLVLVLLVASGGGAWWWWDSARPPEIQYVSVPIERGDIEDATTAIGNLQPFQFVDVGTQVSGQLRKIHVEVGAMVAQGDLLAEIDPTVYLARAEASRAQLLNLQAQLVDKQSQMTLAQQQFQRQTNLMRAEATSQEQLQSAEAALRSAAAQIEAIRAQIRQTESTLRADEANLGYTKIFAPMDGTVVSQLAKQGQTLNANQQAPIILRIADLSTITVFTQVSEADVSKLRLGMEAYFTTLGRPDRRWTGKLRQVMPTPEVLNNVVLFNALFDVPNPTQELMTQMTAQVFFVSAAARDVVTVPLAALRPVGRPGRDGAPANRYIARVLVGENQVVEREVVTGVTNRVSAEVKSGLAAGERVVIGTRGPAARPGGPNRTPRLS
jgi:macrolide-specific efflux system membrane fusion protein